MAAAAQESGCLIVLLLQSFDLHKMAIAILFFANLKIRRENGINHIELVLQGAVLLLKVPDAVE